MLSLLLSSILIYLMSMSHFIGLNE
jgi:hypothetical protein